VGPLAKSRKSSDFSWRWWIHHSNRRNGAHTNKYVYVDRLKFSNNKGRTLESGGSGGKLHTVKIPAGSVLLGFKGRSDAYLDQINFQVAEFQPATFQ
jgi:hypothetical protein